MKLQVLLGAGCLFIALSTTAAEPIIYGIGPATSTRVGSQ